MNYEIAHTANLGDHYPMGKLHNLSRCGKPLLVRYDMDAVRDLLTPERLAERPATLWKWRELLPVCHDSDVITLGEMYTPLLRMRRLESGMDSVRMDGGAIFVKDESRLPTGMRRSCCCSVGCGRWCVVSKLQEVQVKTQKPKAAR